MYFGKCVAHLFHSRVVVKPQYSGTADGRDDSAARSQYVQHPAKRGVELSGNYAGRPQSRDIARHRYPSFGPFRVASQEGSSFADSRENAVEMRGKLAANDCKRRKRLGLAAQEF